MARCKRRFRRLFPALAFLVAISPAIAESAPVEQPIGIVRPELKATAVGPAVPTEAAAKQTVTELVDYLLKYGNDDHIGKNLASVIGLPRPAPIKTQVIEGKAHPLETERTALVVGLVYEPLPDFAKLHEKRPLSIYVLSANASGRDTQSLYFRVNLDGRLERVVTSYGKNDEYLPIRGSGVKFEPDLSSEETRKSYDDAMDRIRTWLAKSPIPPVDDMAEELASARLQDEKSDTKAVERTREQAIADARIAVREIKEGTAVVVRLSFELDQLDMERLRDLRGEILATGNKLRKKQLTRMQHDEAINKIKAQVVEIVVKNRISSLFAAAADLMIEMGDLAAASNYVDKAIEKWETDGPFEWTDWQTENLRWSRRDGSDAYAVKAALMNKQGDVDGAWLAAGEALRLDPQNARAITEQARAADSAIRKLRREAEANLTPFDYKSLYETAAGELKLPGKGPADKNPATALDKRFMTELGEQRLRLEQQNGVPPAESAHYETWTGRLALCLSFFLIGGIFCGKSIGRAESNQERRESARHQRKVEIAAATQYWAPEACPPTKKLIQDALAVLANSPTGAPVAKFIRENDITVEPILSSAAAGLYLPRDKAIYLSQHVGSLPVGIACVIAHEGLHAKQDIAWRMEPCIEKEHQAYFFHFAVYHELLDAGHETIEDGGMHQSYLRFCKQALRMDFKEFSESVLSRCLGAYKVDMAVRGSTAVTLIDRIRIRYDAWHGRRGTESIAQQLQSPRYLLRRFALARTAGIHAERQEWQKNWIAEHRTTLARRIEQA